MLEGVSVGMVGVEEWGFLWRWSGFVFVPAAMGTVAESVGRTVAERQHRIQHRIQLRDGAALFPAGIARLAAFDAYVNFSSTPSHRENK